MTETRPLTAAISRRPTHGMRRLVSNDVQGGNQTAKTNYYKLEMEAPFFRIRLAIWSRELTAATGYKAVVASTEAVLRTTQTNRYTPVVGGVSYNSLVSSANPYGWRPVTFGGAATGSAVAAQTNVRPVCALSDWIECTSVPRTDGSGRHYALVRIQHPSVAGNSSTIARSPITGAGFENWAAAAGQPWHREYNVAVVNSADGVGTLTTMPSGDYQTGDWPFWMDVEVDYAKPTRSWLASGDSITASGGGQLYDFDLWLWRAVAAASTPAAPMTAFNSGASSQQHVTFSNYLPDLIAAGLTFTDVIIQVGSPNDVESVFNTAADRARALDHIDRCRAIGARPYLATRVPNDAYSMGNATEPQRLAENAWARAICATGAATLLDFDLATSNGASPAKWKPGMRQDDYHPSAAGIQAMADVVTAAM